MSPGAYQRRCYRISEDAGLTDLDPAGLKDASGYVFYNTSSYTLQRLVDTAANNRQILEANVRAYLDGFSDNVKEIVDKFKLRAQVSHMAEKDVLLDVLEKFISPYINLTPEEGLDPEGQIRATADVYLYGKEAYAICKSDMMIKGNNPENIKCGSTLATDEFSGLCFDFMLSNPLYGKSWKTGMT